MQKACVWMGMIALMGSISWTQPSYASPTPPAETLQDVDPTQPAPDFEERVEALMNMVKARLDQAARGDNLTVPQKQARILQEALVLLGQMEFYIATFGIHDTLTTIQEIRKFQPVVESHVSKHLTDD